MMTGLQMKTLLVTAVSALALAVTLFSASPNAAAQATTPHQGATAMTLSQAWDKTFAKSEKVDHRKVTFTNRYGVTLAADLYVPKHRRGERLPAIAVGGPFEEFGEEDLDKLIALQFKGSFFFLQAMVGAMDNGGSIIQISSATAQRTGTVQGYEAYVGTKAGIDHVVRAVANFYGRKGIRVNTISAGHTDTPMQKVPLQDWRKAAYADATPLGRYGTCEDVAAAAVWLASDECFMTGEDMQVNGGLTLRRNPLKDDLERYEREWKPA